MTKLWCLFCAIGLINSGHPFTILLLCYIVAFKEFKP